MHCTWASEFNIIVYRIYTHKHFGLRTVHFVFMNKWVFTVFSYLTLYTLYTLSTTYVIGTINITRISNFRSRYWFSNQFGRYFRLLKHMRRCRETHFDNIATPIWTFWSLCKCLLFEEPLIDEAEDRVTSWKVGSVTNYDFFCGTALRGGKFVSISASPIIKS